MVTRTPPLSARYRLAVAARVGAATAGGYAVAVLFGIALATLLPGDPADAAMTATMLALLAIPVAAMACVRARSAGRAWAGVFVAGAAFAGLAFAAGWRP